MNPENGSLQLQGVAIAIAVVLTSIGTTIGARAQSPAAQTFQQVCAVCHTIGGGRLVGPDLASVDQRRSTEWLVEFIRTPMAMINGGDPDAVALYEEYNKVPMPDNNFSEGEVLALIEYIAANSPNRAEPEPEVAEAGEDDSAAAPAEAEAPPPGLIAGRSLDSATDENIRSGAELFSGATRLVHGGPSCITCHTLETDQILSGGTLAKDLSGAFSRLKGAGIAAVVSSPPFPAMADAYRGEGPTDQEVYDLVAFMKAVDVGSPDAVASDRYSAQFLLIGFIGSAGLFLVFSLLWRNRRTKTVNHKVFGRQIKSQ